MDINTIAELRGGRSEFDRMITFLGPKSGVVTIEGAAWMTPDSILTIRTLTGLMLAQSRIAENLGDGWYNAYCERQIKVLENQKVTVRLELEGVWRAMPAMRVTDGQPNLRLMAEM